MKKSIYDILFDDGFKNSVNRDSLQKPHQANSEISIAKRIAYVLKFKGIGIGENFKSSTDFSVIRDNSINEFRRRSKVLRLDINFTRIAAAAAVLIFFTVGGYFIGRNGIDNQDKIVEFKTPKGQQSELILPDGSFVTLNYDSRIKYHITSNKALQQVELEGEAFFKVSKNKSRTFQVLTKNMSVNVLGTEFNVKAYADDNEINTTLLEGSIELKDIKGHKGSVILSPGESWTLSKSNGQQVIKNVDLASSTLWRNGEYHFDRITLDELCRVLERMHIVDIQFKDEALKKETYTGSIYQDEDIEKVFDIINLTVPLKIKKQNKEIWIDRK